jgi:hypothetical protein
MCAKSIAALRVDHPRSQISSTELYAVITRLPVRPRIMSEQGLLFVENVRDYFSPGGKSPSKQVIAFGDRSGPGGRWTHLPRDQTVPVATSTRAHRSRDSKSTGNCHSDR